MLYSAFLLTSGFLFSTEINTIVVDKLVILNISLFTSFILALRLILVAKLVISSILFSIIFILALYKSFFHN